MNLPFGKIEGNSLEMYFSSADYTIANVISAIKEHIDVLEEMEVNFMGACTQIPSQASTSIFEPVNIKATFEYKGEGNPEEILKRTYKIIWKGLVARFPEEIEWAQAKEHYSHFINAQANFLKTRIESLKEE